MALNQPLLSTTPEYNHQPKDVLTFIEFLSLLEKEENYYPNEQNHTKLMVTRLRKIFYDKRGWNSQLIRGASNIEFRYDVEIVKEADLTSLHRGAKIVRRYKNNKYRPKYRVLKFKKDDTSVNDSKVAGIPLIYANDHQEVKLSNGYMCDIAHVLAGMDAFNYNEIVCPLPSFLFFLYRFFPNVKSNTDVVTWLGDIASTAGDFLFDYLQNKKVEKTHEQFFINKDAPGSDMLGNIDAFIISKNYDIGVEKGMRVTEILKDYYEGEKGNVLRKKRFSFFCEAIGLKEWNGYKFDNEKDWLALYYIQLRNNTAFQIFSLCNDLLRSIILPLCVWRNGYKKIIKLNELLRIFLDALYLQVQKEQI